MGLALGVKIKHIIKTIDEYLRKVKKNSLEEPWRGHNSSWRGRVNENAQLIEEKKNKKKRENLLWVFVRE